MKLNWNKKPYMMYQKEFYYPNYGKKVTQNKSTIDKKADSKIKNYVVKSYNQAWSKYYNEKEADKPKFHSYRKSKLSYTSYGLYVINNNYIELPKIGQIKFHGNLLVNEDIANFTVSEKNGKYYCSIIYKDVDIEPKINTNKDLGMDWGEKTFFTDNNGNKYNPKINFELEDKINTLQQQLSNKVLYSNNWFKLALQINKLKEYRSNVLNDWEHKLSSYLVSNFDNIYVEDIVHKILHNEQKHGVSKLKKVYYRTGMFLDKRN